MRLQYAYESLPNILNGYYVTWSSNDWSVVNGDIQCKHGYGIIRSENSIVYKGEFSENKLNGFGNFLYLDGTLYEGQFVNNNFEGIGIYTFNNGDIYEGMFKNGVREGQGTYTYQGSEGAIKYEGSWVNNMKNGIGKMTFGANGEYYGHFENGKRHGEGVYKYLKTKDFEKLYEQSDYNLFNMLVRFVDENNDYEDYDYYKILFADDKYVYIERYQMYHSDGNPYVLLALDKETGTDIEINLTDSRNKCNILSINKINGKY